MSAVETRQLSLATARLLGWERCFEASIWTASIKVCASITADGRGDVTVRLTITVFGRSYVVEHTFDGNQCLEIAVVTGVALKVCVLNWRTNNISVMFKLTLGVTLLGIPITLFEGEIQVPIPVADEIERLTAAQVSSPQELTHLLGLLGSVQLGAGSAGATAAGASERTCSCGGAHASAGAPTAPVCVGVSPSAGSCWFEGRPRPGAHDLPAMLRRRRRVVGGAQRGTRRMQLSRLRASLSRRACAGRA